MKRKIQVVLGFAVGVLLVWLLFRNTKWGEVYDTIRGANKWWLILSQVPIWGSFLARIRRWHYVVRSTEPVPFRTLFSATQIGFLANFTLPARAGEAIRAFLLSRNTSIPFAKSIALVAVDRITDLVGLIVCIGLALVGFRNVGEVVLPAHTLGETETVWSGALVRSLILGGTFLLSLVVVALVMLYLNQRWLLKLVDLTFRRISPKLGDRVEHVVKQFADGLQALGSGGDMAKAILWSLVTWGCFVVSAACMLWGFHLDFPWYMPFLMLTLMGVAISLPGAPGFVGQFDGAIILAVLMVMPEVGATKAQAIAIVVHVLNLIPIAIAGVMGLMMEGTGLMELTRRSAAAGSELEQQETAEELPGKKPAVKPAE